MTYPTLASVNATTDLSNLLIYVNDLTDGVAMPLVLLAFFIIVMLSGYFAQLRFKGFARLDFAFAVSGFATFGMAVLMSLKNGLLNPSYLILSLVVAIIGVIVLYLGREE